MTDYKKYINALRKCAKEYENDRTFTGHIIVADLCRDTANLLEELEQKPYEMTAEEYRQRMIQAFHNAATDELIAICVLPTEKEFEHLEWLLKNHYKKELCEDAISRSGIIAKIEDEYKGYTLSEQYAPQDFINLIEDMPPVTPVEKVEQCEPCEDVISRQAAIDALTKTSGIRGDALKALYDLPPVTPPEGFPYDDFLSKKERLNMLMETGEFDFLKDISPDKIWRLVFMLEFIGSTESEKYIWVVTYYDFNTEPIITVFDNEEAANICYKHFKKYHDICCLDKCPIYSIFEVIKST